MDPTSSQLISAGERLATVFSHFYCVQQAIDAPVLPQQLLPNYEMLLAFNFGPAIPTWLGNRAFVIHQTAVLGPLQQLPRYELPPGADLLVVNFTLNGFYRLLGKPMHRFRAAEWPDADRILDPWAFDALWQELVGIPTQAGRLLRLRSYMLTHLKPVGKPVDDLIDSIPLFAQTVVDPVKSLAEKWGVSPRSIQLHFQANLGYSAKELSRFLRFKPVLNFLIQHPGSSVDWPGVVEQFGYYDQSHLIQNFQYFLGMTPRQFMKEMSEETICVNKSGKFY